MKKKIIAIITTLILTILASIIAVFNIQSNDGTSNQNEQAEHTEKQDADNIIYNTCYYGCPNSKRVNKLNTKKNKMLLA